MSPLVARRPLRHVPRTPFPSSSPADCVYISRFYDVYCKLIREQYHISTVQDLIEVNIKKSTNIEHYATQ